jgi:hypothetical protein
MNSLYITFIGMRIVKRMIWHNKQLVIMLVIRISVSPKNRCACMCKISLSVLGAETGLTGNPIGLTGVLGIQTGLTNTPIDMTGPAIPDNPVLEDSASNNLEHDKANMLIGGDLLLIICRIQVTKLIERFGGLLSSLRW